MTTRKNSAGRVRIFWAVLAVVVAGLGAASSAGAQDATPLEPPVGPVIELPKFEVTDSRLLPPPENWRYAAIPGFEVLSNISERETKRFMQDFLLLQEAVNVIMPALRGGGVSVPTSLILAGRGDGFNRFVPADRGDDRYRTNSLFFDDPERGAIVVDFALAELLLEDNTTQESDPYRSFYKEYFRFLIRRMSGQKPPAWFEEGLVQLFSSIDFTKKWINFAQVGDGFGGERTGDFNTLLVQRALMSFPELFSEQRGQSRSTFWSAQAYAFVHMCLYGRGQIYQKPFVQFLTRIGNEPPTEEIFVECFKKDYKKMLLELRGYIGFTDYKSLRYTAKKGQALPEPPPVTLRPANEAEVGRIVGETLRLGGHGEKAHLALIAPYIRGERDPALLAALGLDERMAKHDERAQKFLEAAAKGGVVRPRAYLELARLRLAGGPAGNTGDEKRLEAGQVAHVLEPLLLAHRQPPPMAEVYELIATVWMRSEKPPTREDLTVINQGVNHFSRRPTLLWRAATLNLRHGDPEIAREIVTYALRVLPPSVPRMAFEQLAAELPPPSPEAAKAPAAKAPAAKRPGRKS
ncbi:MAG: hypothetical protein HY736_25705 [Verrucomicrobia bacterium]|nr:hypothetical protein [Verrucomicrobiota bacterium]